MIRLACRDFLGVARFSEEDQKYYGKIAGIRDLVDFEADTRDNVGLEFFKAVKDYIAMCEDVGCKPQKSLPGRA